MRGVIIGGLCAALMATSAMAQVTRCGAEFGKWVCRTEQPRQEGPSIFEQSQLAMQRAYDQAQRESQDRANIQAGRAANARQALADAEYEHRQALEANVALAVREGRCGEARDLALGVSDMALADHAQRLCTPR